MIEVAVLVPVLGRPENARPLVESWSEAQTVPSRLVFIANHDDRAQVEACLAVGNLRLSDGLVPRVETKIVRWSAGHADFARKINHVYRHTSEPFIFQGADDLTFCPGWDREAMHVADVTGAGVVGTNDHGNPTVMRGHHSTHTLIRRAYIDEHGGSLDGPGVVFHEGYGHQWVDTELVELAKSRGQWAFAPRASVCHDHPFWDAAVPTDDTYRKGQASATADRALYMQRSRQWKPRRSPSQ